MAAKSFYAPLGAKSRAPLVGERAGDVVVANSRMAITEAPEASDLFYMLKMPANHKIKDWYFANNADLCTSNTITCSVGRITSAGAIDNALITEGTSLQAASFTRATALSAMMHGYFATDQDIGFKIVAAPTGTAIPTGLVVLCVEFVPISGGETLLT